VPCIIRVQCYYVICFAFLTFHNKAILITTLFWSKSHIDYPQKNVTLHITLFKLHNGLTQCWFIAGQTLKTSAWFFFKTVHKISFSRGFDFLFVYRRFNTSARPRRGLGTGIQTQSYLLLPGNLLLPCYLFPFYILYVIRKAFSIRSKIALDDNIYAACMRTSQKNDFDVKITKKRQLMVTLREMTWKKNSLEH